MPDMQYTYAVARIRSKELSLLTNQFLDQVLASKTYQEGLQLLLDKGWGYSDGGTDSDSILSAEQEKTWGLIRELTEDISVFDVFLYANDYHNLKAAIKLATTDTEIEKDQIFINNGTIDPEVILNAVKERDYQLLPEHMRASAEEAFQTLLHTQDGQLCDIIVDKAALLAIQKAGEESVDALIAEYAEIFVAIANIKIAVRAQNTAKSRDFIERALAPCKTLDIPALAQAAVNSFDAICEYLTTTKYASGVPYLRESSSAFERWCDNLVIDNIRAQKTNPFTLGPLAAYILARENEIKTIRIILSGLLNDLPIDSIRERLREMYV